jgi:hypothetical protein
MRDHQLEPQNPRLRRRERPRRSHALKHLVQSRLIPQASAD